MWEVDPLECPKCGAEMKIVSFINDEPVIEKILRHLGLWRSGKPGRSPPCLGVTHRQAEIIWQDDTETRPFDDGRPGYDEPEITLN